MSASFVAELRLLGPARIAGTRGQDVDALARQSKRFALLAYLVAATPRGMHRRDSLLGMFWPELDASHARNSLSQALHTIRSTLGEAVLATRGDGEIGVALGALSSDLEEFDAAIGVKDELALELYRGDFLDGFFIQDAPEFERWLEARRSDLRAKASGAAWRHALACADRQDAVGAARWASWAAERGLPAESQLRRLMMFLQELGDRAAAIRAYDEFVSRLARDFDLTPSRETDALAATIRGDALLSRSKQTSLTSHAHEPLPAADAASEVRRAPSPVGQVRRAWVTIAALTVVTAVLAVALKRPDGAEGPSGRIPRVAVLPFENLGPQATAYLAGGIRNEIGSRLAVIRGIAVTYSSDSRGADFAFGGTTSWEPLQGGRGRLRVRLELTNARDSARIWGAVFERDSAGVPELFDLYAQIAQRVVDELHLLLRTPQVPQSALAPTKDAEAYDDYLRALDYLQRSATAANFRAAVSLLERATRRDTAFAAAFAHLAIGHTNAVWVAGLGDEHFALGRVAAERALRLDPNLADAHTAIGLLAYTCCADYERALFHLTAAQAMRPADYQPVMLMGSVHKRQGRWTEAIEDYRRAARLNPLLRWPAINLGHAQLWARQYVDAEQTFRRALEREPQDIFAPAHLALLYVLRDGDTRAANAVMAEAKRSSDGYRDSRMPYYLAVLERRYDAALAELQPPEPGLTASLLNEWLVDDEIRAGLVHRLRGDSAAARAAFDSARRELEATLSTTSPESRRNQLLLRGGLAIAYAGLGRPQPATREATFVTESSPMALDAIEGPKYLQHAALAHVMLGNHDTAIRILESILQVAAPVSSRSLALEPFWDPLRGDPRFDRLARP